MADLISIVRQLDSLSLPDQLIVAAGLLGQNRPELARTIAQRVIDQIDLAELLAKPTTKSCQHSTGGQ
jgi:hypothetical protein